MHLKVQYGSSTLRHECGCMDTRLFILDCKERSVLQNKEVQHLGHVQVWRYKFSPQLLLKGINSIIEVAFIIQKHCGKEERKQTNPLMDLMLPVLACLIFS